MAYITGHRKFRLYRRKNEERKKLFQVSSLPVSVPLSEAISVFKVSVPLDLLSYKVSIPLSEVTKSPVKSLTTLQSRVKFTKSLPTGWLDVSELEGFRNYLAFCKLACESTSGNPRATFTLRIHGDFTWMLLIGGRQVLPSDHPVLVHLPSSLATVSGVVEVLERLDSLRVCPGNADEKFSSLRSYHKGVFTSGATTTAIVECNVMGHSTIRHSGCELLLESCSSSSRCPKCEGHRKSLHAMLSRRAKESPSDQASPSSHSNFRYLSSPVKLDRLSRTHTLLRQAKQHVERLKRRIETLSEVQGVTIDQATHDDLQTIVKENTTSIHEQHPPNSFQRLFWDQQQQAATVCDARSMRWHPLMIKWCLYLRHISSKAYEVVRQSGCVKLPSQRTLRDYTHFTSSTIGFSAEVDQHLMDVANMEHCKEYEKYVLLLMDEMYVKEDLVYDKHTGALTGFSNLGQTNEHLLQLEHQLRDDAKDTYEPLAKTMLVLMVRGLFTRLQFPYTQFACASVSGDLLFLPVWDAIARLERCGFKVLAITCDGASPNRRLFNLHRSEKGIIHKVQNPHTSEDRYIYFISDPPHLLKTTRNCWASKCRHLWCNGKEISWHHLERLYQNDSGACRDAPGLSLVPKLKYEHIYLTSFSKMRVDLAAQVLSQSVAKALQLTGGSEVEETSKFVDMFDKFFDCMNVNNFTTAYHKRKIFQQPYRSGTDFRLKWLKEEFLTYLDKWEESVKSRGEFSTLAKKQMLLSPETLLGLRITVKSFVDMVEFIFTIPGVTTFLSERLSQDPLEKFFGCQRQRGGVNENPNVRDFCKNTQALRVIHSTCIASVRGNCRGNKEQIDFDKENMPLAKRRRKH